ncbi:hypothetical protein [Planctomycetes bacterium K23_9]|uniref:Uncharacterized protein n=1 Tax=Stieleria marina TaxID=1930275 RepID=A0A517P2P1_9BACT|nr:hypothetical protein K239x_56530 [Planctomycetes bacterium K23_9]
MQDQLAPLYLLPPPANTPWAGTPGQTIQSQVARTDADPLIVNLPLFWYDPRWSRLTTQQADDLAVAVSRYDVLVSALRSDLAGADTEPSFHAPIKNESDEESPGEVSPDSDAAFFPRIVPYRPERYGLNAADFDQATIIDVRLMMPRDTSGRFAYSPDQIARWESKTQVEDVEGSWVPAATFPPDVDSFENLPTKLQQLRYLAPSAAVFTSIGPYRLEEEIPLAVGSKPDGLIVRFDEVALEPLQLAALTRRARQLMNAANAKHTPLWIVPGEITADDAVKLVALGADAIGVDAWCNPLMDDSQIDQSSHYSSRIDFDELAEEALYDLIERFSGLYLSLQRVPRKERLGSFSTGWAKTLNIKALR